MSSYWIHFWTYLLGIPVIIALFIYALSLVGIFVTQVPSGEIVVIMIGEEVWKYLGNIPKHWIHPETGLVWRYKALGDGYDNIQQNGKPGSRVKPIPKNLPVGFWGIYWVGFPPFAQLYIYRFRWNKWEKKDGKDASEFVVQPHDTMVDSLYWTSAYAFQIKGAKNADNVPIDAIIVVTIRVVNADIALFGIKNGWLANFDGKVEGATRDFIGSATIPELTRLSHESGEKPFKKGVDPRKEPSSEISKSFIDRIMVLNNSTEGNTSILETLGVEVVSVSFVNYEISDNALKKEWQEAMTLPLIAEQRAASFKTETAAIEDRTKRLGAANAEAAEKLALAVAKNPHAAAITQAEEARRATEAIAAAIKENKTATTYVFGGGVMPTMNVGKN